MSSFFRYIKNVNRVGRYEPSRYECGNRYVKAIINLDILTLSVRYNYLCFYFYRCNYFGFKKNVLIGNARFYCLESMRMRAVLGKLGWCRFGLKFLGEQGLLPGFQRASW